MRGPRRSELGWIVLMGVVAVTVGFVIGGGLSLFGSEEATLDVTAATSTTTTAADRDVTVSTTSTTEAETTTTTVAARPPGEVAVRAYNGSTTAGQAVRVGQRLEAAGYQVLTPGPSPPDPVAASVVQYAEGFAAEAAALADLLGLPASAVAPVPQPPTVAGIGPASIVLIVGDDLVVSP